MSDWSNFRRDVLAGTRQRELPDACDRVWAWLDLAVEERARAAQSVATETAARWMFMAFPFVRMRLRRESTAASDPAATERRWAAVQEISDIVVARFPTAVLPPASANPQLEALNAAVPVLTDAIGACGAGRATPSGVAALESAIDAFSAITATWQPPLLTDHAWWMGAATVELGRAELELGQVDAAHAAFERAERYYDAAGAQDHAADCRERLRALAEGRTANFDSAASRQLRLLVGEQDPLARAKALAALAGEMRKTGDRYEAAKLAEEAASLLVAAGYPDPEPQVDRAVQGWIDTARQSINGDALMAHLMNVGMCYVEVLGDRAGLRSDHDSEGTDRAQHCLQAMGLALSEMSVECEAAHQSVAARLDFWYTGNVSQPAPAAAVPVIDSAGRAAALDDALYRLRLACNAAPRPELVDEVRRLQDDARALGSRIHLARAQFEEAYVLIWLDRPADALPAVDTAQRTLLGERAPALAAFSTGYERELYLTGVDLKARALANLRDHEALLALCEPVVRDIETERARVSSPYQQSAFLATRAGLYEFCAAAAYRLKRWDLLLETSELLKARASLRSLAGTNAAIGADARVHAPAVPTVETSARQGTAASDPPDLAAIEKSYRETSAALAAAERGSSTAAALIERRRWLADARAIATARATDGSAIAPIDVAAVQQALADDEAAISWFWIGTETLLVQAFTRDAHDAAHVILEPAQRAQYDTYLEAIRAFAGPTPAYDAIIPALDELIPQLVPVLLPPAIRDFVAGRTRLILCPHRTLHLFPFHAARFSDGWLIDHCAVRYVPNMSSLLLPWHGHREGPVLALGIGTFDDPGIAALPSAEAEAREVASSHREQGHLIIRPTRAEFTALPLANYRCLHLATHGSSVLAGDALNDPLGCGIQLADGTLDGWDIAALELRAELVVLATCHSGQRAVGGRGLAQLPGDDMFGLQAVLFEAGVGTLLGALWPVDDESARAILVDFHRAYAAGEPSDRALQSAQKAHLANPARRQNLYDWAPFFLTSLGRPRAGV